MSKNNITLKIMKALAVILNSALLGLLAIAVLQEGISGMDYLAWTFLLLLSSAALFTLVFIFFPQIARTFRLAGKTMRGAGRSQQSGI